MVEPTAIMSYDNPRYHFWQGICSEFPLCCILYFCDVVVPYDVTSFSTSDEWRKVKTGSDYPYVQCPECLSKNLEIKN